MKKNNKKTKLFSLIFLILLGVYFQTIAYSAIASNLTITGDAIARIRSNVRINKFKIHEVSNGVISSYEDFSKTYTMSNVTLPYNDSYIIYELVVGNYEDVEMQLSNITGLNSNLTYELIDYNLHDMICDNTNKCFGGVEKTFYLKIKYSNYNASGTNYNINLNYEFKEFSNKLMIGNSFKDTIPSTATHLVFTDEKPASGVALTDVSADQDMGVVGYLDGTTYKVSTRRTGIMPEANADSSYMFNGTALTNIDLSNLDVSTTTSINGMFKDCTSLTNVNFGSNWDSSNINYMEYLFYKCSSLSTIDLSKFNTSNVISLSYMFCDCIKLTNLDLSGFDTRNVTTMESMFSGCSALTSVDVVSFNTGKVTSMKRMFAYCSVLEDVDVSGFNTEQVTDFYSMFTHCLALTELDVSEFNTSKATNMYSMFRNCNVLNNLDVSNFDTSKVITMEQMFLNCCALETVDVSKWETSSVQNFRYIFSSCELFTFLNVSNWNTQNATNMEYMFYDCNNLMTVDVSNWDVSKVTKINGMFGNCYVLSIIDVSKWDTSNVVDMSGAFCDCRVLKVIDVSNWKTPKTTDMENMFYNCYKVEMLDLSGFDTTNVTSMKIMFQNMHCLKEVTFGDKWSWVGENGYLPEPKSYSITGADGYWYDLETGQAYDRLSIPANTAATYVAVNPNI